MPRLTVRGVSGNLRVMAYYPTVKVERKVMADNAYKTEMVNLSARYEDIVTIQ